MIHRVLAAALIVITLSIIFVRSAPADTLHVPDPYPTIQAAIDAAQDGDTVLVADGTYTGEGNRYIDYAGKAITVRSGNGAENCIIDSEGGRGFHFHSGETLASVLNGFTITNGSGSTPGGGGILCENSNPTIENCAITDNQAVTGCGICCLNSSPTIEDCSIIANHGGGEGGGIYADSDSSPYVINCVIADNHLGGVSRGGGISCLGAVLIDCVISGNNITDGYGNPVGYGGGVYGVPTLIDCSITDNMAGHGGGVYCGLGTIIRCEIRGNWCPHKGRGIYVSGDAAITECISWDQVYCDGGGPTITNCTLHTTVAFEGTNAVVTNSILGGVWCPHPSQCGNPTVTYCLTDRPGEGNIEGNPLFVDPDGPDNIPGTPDDNLRLQAGSPCIDAGNNLAVPADDSDLDGDSDTNERLPVDFDGRPRFLDHPGRDDTGVPDPPDYPAVVDMGAYEFLPGDLDYDLDVDLVDLAQLLGSYGITAGADYEDGDLDCDGDVDLTSCD